LILVLLLPALPARAEESRIPQPPELQRDVDFWIRVYTEATTREGFLHDERDLSLVYAKLQFGAGATAKTRRAMVDTERRKIEAMLRRLAAGATELSVEEQQLAGLFGPAATGARFAEAARQVRFQLGQSDRFREGLERSGIWESYIAQTFSSRGLPPELAVLPHVESSFNPAAYSKVGAAGLWQFMRSTGRLYLRVDEAVDERLDPFRATEAAAQLLDSNFRLLDSWPLALTAYNHGANGMQRARETMGTTDIATILRNYSSPSFGFASRNFFVSFLAALTIDANPEKYFSNLARHPAMSFTEVEVPAFVPMASLLRTVKVEKSQLLALNPALRQPVWEGRQYVPRGYRLRLPETAVEWTTDSLAQQIDVQDQYENQPRARSHRVKAGDTLAAIARKYGTSVSAIARLNGLRDGAEPKVRATLRLPDIPATRITPPKLVASAMKPTA
jgi:membrane-bound lytic murein transglycosylase D